MNDSFTNAVGIKRRRRAGGRTRRGAAAVEFAIILPLLVTIVLACIDFGRFGYMYIAVTNSARAGAGFGSVQKVTTGTLPAWRTAIRRVCTDEIDDSTGFVANRLTIPDPVIITEQGGLRRVQVRVNYQFHMLVSWPGLPSQVALSRTVEMRVIR
jgi:Flp pilus assembly protein TadG